MADGVVMVAPATLIRIFFLLLYLPACLIAFRWLFPHLSTASKQLATLVLAAQWSHDQPSLGPRLPTRLWYSGLSASETWQIPLLADLSSGEYQAFAGLYRISDQERVPASDARGTTVAEGRVPLGSVVVQ